MATATISEAFVRDERPPGWDLVIQEEASYSLGVARTALKEKGGGPGENFKL